MYDECSLAMKCDNYGTACFLHLKTVQFIEKHKKPIMCDSGASRRRTTTMPTISDSNGLTTQANCHAKLKRHQTLFSFFNIKTKLKNMHFTKLTTSLSLSQEPGDCLSDARRRNHSFGSKLSRQGSLSFFIEAFQ
jgi:hypothetical protein